MAIGNQSSNKIVLEVKVAEQGKGLSETDLQNLNDFKENYSKILKVTESEEVLPVVDLASRGVIDYKSVVSRRLPLAQAGEGYEALRNRQIQGRAVVDMSL